MLLKFPAALLWKSPCVAKTVACRLPWSGHLRKGIWFDKRCQQGDQWQDQLTEDMGSEINLCFANRRWVTRVID